MTKRWAIIALLTAMSLLAGCSEVTGPEDVERLEVSVAVVPLEVGPGESANLSMAIRNPTARPIEFQTNTCVVSLWLEAASGERVGLLSDPMCLDMGVRHRLEPGETLRGQWVQDPDTEWPLQVAAEGGLRSVKLWGEDLKVEPGLYRVVADLGVEGSSPASSAPIRIE